MALINCPQCTHKISDQAHTCPKCQYSAHQETKKSWLNQDALPFLVSDLLLYIIGFVVFVVLLFSGVGIILLIAAIIIFAAIKFASDLF